MTVAITAKDKLKLAILYKRLCKAEELNEEETDLMDKLLNIACHYSDIAEEFNRIDTEVFEFMQAKESN